MVQPVWKIQFLTKLNIVLLYNPTVRLLNYLPKRFENLCLKKKKKHMWILAVLFIKLKTRGNHDVI